MQKVVKVFSVAAGKGICRAIAAGKGVHKGIQRAADHHKKRIAHRVLFAATQRRVLQNVCHAGGIHRQGAQRHQKHILGVVRRQMIMPRASADVFVFLHLQLQRWNCLAAQPAECRMVRAWLQIIGAGLRITRRWRLDHKAWFLFRCWCFLSGF